MTGIQDAIQPPICYLWQGDMGWWRSNTVLLKAKLNISGKASQRPWPQISLDFNSQPWNQGKDWYNTQASTSEGKKIRIMSNTRWKINCKATNFKKFEQISIWFGLKKKRWIFWSFLKTFFYLALTAYNRTIEVVCGMEKYKVSSLIDL